MTCSDFVNPLKMLICYKKHPVSGANHGYTKKIDGQLYETLSAVQFSANFDI